MQSIHAIAHFDDDGTVSIKAPGLASAGEHPVFLILEPETAQHLKSGQISLQTLDLGSDAHSLRREDIYGADGR